MTEHLPTYVRCPLIVLRVNESQVMGDTVADTLRDELQAAYRASGAVHVVIDLQQVAYLSSAGIRPLLALNRDVRDREGRLLLCNLSEDVESVFIATRLVSTSPSTPSPFEKHADVPAAVASLYHGGS
jgi:anti-anti-sigma factor